MIAIFEFFWRGISHAPSNAVTLKTVATAFPNVRVLFCAEVTHLAEVRRFVAADAHPTLEFEEIASPPRNILRLGSFLKAVREILRHFERVLRGPGDLAVICQGDGASLYAAWLFHTLFPRRQVYFQFRLHGNLNEVLGWRSRNPLRRVTQLDTALILCASAECRPVVLDEHIRLALCEMIPALAPFVQVLQDAANEEENAGLTPQALRHPIKIATLGVQTKAKGYPLFLRLAEAVTRALPGQVEFHAIGRIHEEVRGYDHSALAHAPILEYVDRTEYAERLAEMHYVCLPYSGDYYRLAASGVLVDAIGFAKPIISLPVAFMMTLFEEHGDVGYLCCDEAELISTVRGLVRDPDRTRYEQQCEALSRARDARCVTHLAEHYAALVRDAFPRFRGDRVAASGRTDPR